METHFIILFKLFIYVITRYRTGQRFSIEEKFELQKGLFALGADFFSRYIPNESELGQSRLDISPHSNFCLPEQSYNENEEEVPLVLQDSEIRPTVSGVLCRIRTQRKRPFFKTHAKYRNSFKVASRRAQSS